MRIAFLPSIINCIFARFWRFIIYQSIIFTFSCIYAMVACDSINCNERLVEPLFESVDYL